MSALGLESFITYKSDNSAAGYSFYPAPRSIDVTDGGVKVVLGNIPASPDIPLPKDVLVVLYGFKDPLEEMKKQYAIARKNGANVVKVSFELDVGELPQGNVTVDEILNTKVLNLHRLALELQTMIVDGVNVLVAKENKTFVLYDKIADAAARPDLICQFVREEPMFKHIEAVVVKIPEGRKHRQIAMIFNTNVSNITFRGEMPFELTLPNSDGRKIGDTMRSEVHA